MANEVRITIGADTKQADKAVRSFRQNLDNISRRAKVAGAALSVMGAAGLVAIKGFAEAALTQQRALDSLAIVVGNVGENFADLEAEIMATTAALQRKTNYGDEAQLRVLAQLVPMLGSTSNAMAALPAIMEVAAVQGKDFESVVATIGPVLAGMTDRVRGTSLEFDKSQGPMERVESILAQLGGTAEAQANPFTQMSNAVGDLKEKLGDELLPMLRPILSRLQGFAERLQEVNPRILKLVAATLAAVTALGLVGGPLLLLIGLLPILITGFSALSAAMLPITVAAAAIVVAVTAAIAIYRNWSNIQQFLIIQQIKFKNTIDLVKSVLKIALIPFKSFIETLKMLINLISKLGPLAKRIFGFTQEEMSLMDEGMQDMGMTFEASAISGEKAAAAVKNVGVAAEEALAPTRQLESAWANANNTFEGAILTADHWLKNQQEFNTKMNEMTLAPYREEIMKTAAVTEFLGRTTAAVGNVASSVAGGPTGTPRPFSLKLSPSARNAQMGLAPGETVTGAAFHERANEAFGVTVVVTGNTIMNEKDMEDIVKNGIKSAEARGAFVNLER